MLLKNEWVAKEINEEIKKKLSTGNQWQYYVRATTQNKRDTEKAVLIGKLIAFQGYLNKREKLLIKYLTPQFKDLKSEQKSQRVSRKIK